MREKGLHSQLPYESVYVFLATCDVFIESPNDDHEDTHRKILVALRSAERFSKNLKLSTPSKVATKNAMSNAEVDEKLEGLVDKMKQDVQRMQHEALAVVQQHGAILQNGTSMQEIEEKFYGATTVDDANKYGAQWAALPALRVAGMQLLASKYLQEIARMMEDTMAACNGNANAG